MLRGLTPLSARGEVEVVGAHVVFGGAAELDVDRLIAVSVPQLDGGAGLIQPAVAPLHEPDKGGEQVGSLVGEPVTLPRALAGLAVVLAFEEPLPDEFAQAAGGDGFAEAGALAKSSKRVVP